MKRTVKMDTKLIQKHIPLRVQEMFGSINQKTTLNDLYAMADDISDMMGYSEAVQKIEQRASELGLISPPNENVIGRSLLSGEIADVIGKRLCDGDMSVVHAFRDILESSRMADYICSITYLKATFYQYRLGYLYWRFYQDNSKNIEKTSESVVNFATVRCIENVIEGEQVKSSKVLMVYETESGDVRVLTVGDLNHMDTVNRLDTKSQEKIEFIETRPKSYWRSLGGISGIMYSYFWDTKTKAWVSVPVELIKGIATISAPSSMFGGIGDKMIESLMEDDIDSMVDRAMNDHEMYSPEQEEDDEFDDEFDDNDEDELNE